MGITRGPAPQIDALVETVYLREILFRCEYVRGAEGRLRVLKEDQPLEVFRELTAFLQHAAAVSRILWPAPWGSSADKKRAERRGQHLRAVLGIPDDHGLSDRKLRNEFEHFDECLDEWAESTAGKCLIDLMTAPRSARSDVADGVILRWFDPTSGTLYFRGTAFKIRSIIEAVKYVEARAADRRRLLEATVGKPRIISSTGSVI